MCAAFSRRTALGLLGAAGLTTAAGLTAPTATAQPAVWAQLAAQVRRETRWAWRNYVAKAFGHDQIKPVSGGFEEFFVPGHPVGLTIVERSERAHV